MKFSRYISFLTIFSALCFTACEDELPYDSVVIGEGEATVDAQVSFHALESALESRAAGNAVDVINELWMVIYEVNADGTEKGLYEKVRIYDSSDNDYVLPGSDFDIDQDGNTANPPDAEVAPSGSNPDGNIGPSGESTPTAKFKLRHIPYGRYKMFAVANVDLTDVDCTTIEDLRNTRFKWNTNVSLDCQMFGYFTLATQPTSSSDAPVITVNQSTLRLHSWIKRLVSKVTVSFDPSGLEENVHIYIKSVTIHDIPASCALGLPNSPDSDDELIKNGESFTYYQPGQSDNEYHTDWDIHLTKGSGPMGEVNHTESDKALYFFENMQGDYQGQSKYDKQQDPDAVGTPIDTPEDGEDYKDTRLYGTYIEVEAFYDSRNKDKLTSGPIKYRFMLGKNVTYNYDAERNYHYKLTLKFRGWANEADWHISYREYSPTLITPEPYYISYLYGQEMDFPARVLTGDEDVLNYTVKAEIVENNWWPWDWDPDAENSTGKRPDEFVPGGLAGMQDINGFAWNVPAFDNVFPCVPYSKEKYTSDFPYGGSNYVGFLSLRPNEADVIGTDAEITAAGLPLDKYGYGASANTYLKNYYKDHNLAVNEYPLNGPGTSYDPIDKSLSVLIPMYTRNKEMVPSTDFTGNNPFNAYWRYAKVRFTLWKDGQQVSFKNEEGEEETERVATIYQVPRVENPKAIYRDWNNDDPFDVKLMILPNAGTSRYQTFTSDGPWRASILCQSEPFIELTGKDGKTVRSTSEYISGSTGETIEFTYKPTSKLGSASATRCGVIKVEYHDYNCVHLIIVRQGYHQGVQLGNAKWSCYNVYATSGDHTSTYEPGTDTSVKVALTRSPLSVGSFLKRSQYNYSIREANNDTYGWLAAVGSNNLSTVYVDASGNSVIRPAQWGQIQGFGWTNFGINNQALAQRATNRKWADTWTAVGGFQDGQQFDVPTAENLQSLTDNCKFGYGIVYADGAVTTADEFSIANGYTDYDNTGAESAKGVRACVVYDETTGNNILFPLGAVGQARRVCTAPSGSNGWGTVPFSDPGVGTIAYSGLRQYLGGVANRNRPLTYNNYRNPGALYWIKQPVMTDTPSNIAGVNRPSYASWDINYLTIVFNPYAYNSLSGWNDENKVYSNSGVNASSCSDALPIKLIYKN